MESFSLLKYWRGTGASAASTTVPSKMRSATTTTTTIAASALRPSSESDSEDDGNDEGPFFDLEFALPNDDSDCDAESINENDSFAATDEEEEEEEGEFKFAVSPAADSSDPSLTLSPSDELFFKGHLVPLDPDSKPQHAVPLLKTATKLRVFMLALRKPKATAEAAVAAAATVTSSKVQQRQSKFFIKFKVDDVPIVSLFTRDNSSRGAGPVVKAQAAEDPATAAEERRFTKEVVQKYLSKIKPLYLKVSKRYIEKLRFAGEPNDKEQIDGESSGGSTQSSNEEAVVENGGVGKRQIAIVSAGLKVVYKRLGKNRPASSAVAAAPSPTPPPPTAQRRDDSLLQQQDGIQSAILHCKRSFHAARESRLPPVSDKGGVMSEVDEEGQA